MTLEECVYTARKNCENISGFFFSQTFSFLKKNGFFFVKIQQISRNYLTIFPSVFMSRYDGKLVFFVSAMLCANFTLISEV